MRNGMKNLKCEHSVHFIHPPVRAYQRKCQSNSTENIRFRIWIVSARERARAFSPITHTRCKRFTQILSYDMYAILQKTIFYTNEIFHMVKYFWIRPHFLSIDICKRLQSIVYLLRVRFGWNARCTVFFPLCSAIYARWTHFKCKRTKQM